MWLTWNNLFLDAAQTFLMPATVVPAAVWVLMAIFSMVYGKWRINCLLLLLEGALVLLAVCGKGTVWNSRLFPLGIALIVLHVTHTNWEWGERALQRAANMTAALFSSPDKSHAALVDVTVVPVAEAVMNAMGTLVSAASQLHGIENVYNSMAQMVGSVPQIAYDASASLVSGTGQWSSWACENWGVSSFVVYLTVEFLFHHLQELYMAYTVEEGKSVENWGARKFAVVLCAQGLVVCVIAMILGADVLGGVNKIACDDTICHPGRIIMQCLFHVFVLCA